MRIPLYSRYPVLVGLENVSRFILGYDASLVDVLSYVKNYANRALARLESAVKRIPYSPSTNANDEVSSFYLAIALAQHTDQWLLARLADFEGKRVSTDLVKEPEEELLEILRRLNLEVEFVGSRDGCGHRIVLGKSGSREVIACYPYRVSIPKYLRYAENLLSEPDWKLVNRVVLKGFVYLSRRDLARLAEEIVKRRIVEYGKALSGDAVRDVLQDLIPDTSKLIPERIRSGEARKVPAKVESAFPPCMARLKELLAKGEHLSHHQRFALATFLLAVGYSVDEIIEFFKTSPDFDEKIARYQIEHLAGLRGSRKRYYTYSCGKMRALGMCVADCGTRSPVQYYRHVARRLKTPYTHSRG